MTIVPTSILVLAAFILLVHWIVNRLGEQLLILLGIVAVFLMLPIVGLIVNGAYTFLRDL